MGCAGVMLMKVKRQLMAQRLIRSYGIFEKSLLDIARQVRPEA
jgi:hypothetical protein